MITRTELLSRARIALNHETPYVLGGTGGVSDLERLDVPDLVAKGLDCSSFVDWALGVRKYERGRAWLKNVNGGYFNTDGVWWDAVETELGIFNLLSWINGAWVDAQGRLGKPEPLPGDLIVYPAAWVVRAGAPTRHAPANVPVGHIALITDPIPDSSGAPLVIDCSSGNWSNHGDAIREHRWFPKHPAAIVARCTLVTD